MRQGRSFAEENFVSGSTMRTIQGLRRQLERNLTEIGGVIASNLRGAPVCTPEEAVKLSRSVLAAGLPSNVARTEVMRESKGNTKGKPNAKKSFRYKIGVATAGDSGRCWIHPTSVLSERELPDATQVKILCARPSVRVHGLQCTKAALELPAGWGDSSSHASRESHMRLPPDVHRLSWCTRKSARA